jgi:hypothetical protein
LPSKAGEGLSFVDPTLPTAGRDRRRTQQSFEYGSGSINLIGKRERLGEPERTEQEGAHDHFLIAINDRLN